MREREREGKNEGSNVCVVISNYGDDTSYN